MVKVPFFLNCEFAFSERLHSGAQEKLTKDGENDHEEEEQREDVHEGRQGLEDLAQVAGETNGARRGEAQPGTGQGPGGAGWDSSVGYVPVKMGGWCSRPPEH